MTDRKEISFKSLLSEKQYLKNLAGATITRFGDGIDTIAFAWLIYEITGSKSLLAITFGVSGLPNLIFGMFSGVITSYFPKKNTIFLCDILRGSLALTISILYFSGNVTTFHILLVTFLNSTLESFRHPPSISIMPLILKEEKIDLGLSFNASLTNASQ
ncbi:MAG: MFS transporter, partial [Clostridium sp.]